MRSVSSIAIAVVCAALLGAGSAAAQPPPRTSPAPEVPSPAEVAQAADEGPASRPAAEAGFRLEALITPGTLTAREVAARAVRTAPSMERARAAVQAAEAGAARAFVGVLPVLEVSGRYTRLSEVDQGSLTGGGGVDPGILQALVDGVEDPESRELHNIAVQTIVGLSNFEFPQVLDQYAIRATLSYPVSDLFLRILPAYSGARAARDAQRIQTRSQEQTIGLQATETYFTYARALAALEIARSALEQVTAHERQVQALVDAGVAPRVDLMRIQAQAATARVGVARAQGGVASAEQALRTLLHMAPNERVGLGEDIIAPPRQLDRSREDYLELAKRRRAEVRAMRRIVEARESFARAEAGGRWPSLAVQGNVDYANPNQRVFPQREEWNATWDVSAVLRWNLNQALTAQQNMNVAEAELAQARADLAALEDGLRIEVTRAYEDFVAASAALEAARVGIAAAEESYRVRSEQLRAGVVVTSDLIDAEAELARARIELVNAMLDVQIATARLDRAIAE